MCSRDTDTISPIPSTHHNHGTKHFEISQQRSSYTKNADSPRWFPNSTMSRYQQVPPTAISIKEATVSSMSASPQQTQSIPHESKTPIQPHESHIKSATGSCQDSGYANPTEVTPSTKLSNSQTNCLSAYKDLPSGTILNNSQKRTSGTPQSKPTSYDSDNVSEDICDGQYLCEKHIWNICADQDKCPQYHGYKDVPYIWQYGLSPKSNLWKDFPGEANDKTELSYCGIERTLHNVKVSHFVYLDINFVSMSAQVYIKDDYSCEPHGVKVGVRRLSTRSYSDGEGELSHLTLWCWYWRDDKYIWNTYDSPERQYTMEKKYLFGQMEYYFEYGNFRYKLSFRENQMVQENLQTGTRREVMRRPVYVSKHDVQQRRILSHPCLLQQSPEVKYQVPHHWSPLDLLQPFEQVKLLTDSKSFQDIQELFHATLDESLYTITAIFRVQNPTRWITHCSHKLSLEHTARREGFVGNVEERMLFHGTDTEKVIYGICVNGFDFRLNGKNGTSCGKGAYFARNASYSNKYTARGSSNYMFCARVLVGQYTKGNSDYKRPPQRKRHILYDSCVDNITKPRMFVIFHQDQAYPEFLIQYEDNSRTPNSVLTSARRAKQHSSLYSTLAVGSVPPSSTAAKPPLHPIATTHSSMTTTTAAKPPPHPIATAHSSITTTTVAKPRLHPLVTPHSTMTTTTAAKQSLHPIATTHSTMATTIAPKASRYQIATMHTPTATIGTGTSQCGTTSTSASTFHTATSVPPTSVAVTTALSGLDFNCFTNQVPVSSDSASTPAYADGSLSKEALASQSILTASSACDTANTGTVLSASKSHTSLATTTSCDDFFSAKASVQIASPLPASSESVHREMTATSASAETLQRGMTATSVSSTTSSWGYERTSSTSDHNVTVCTPLSSPSVKTTHSAIALSGLDFNRGSLPTPEGSDIATPSSDVHSPYHSVPFPAHTISSASTSASVVTPDRNLGASSDPPRKEKKCLLM